MLMLGETVQPACEAGEEC